MVLFIAITLLLLVVVLLCFLFIDRKGEPLSERVTVKRRKFTPGTIIFTGKVIVPVANSWTLAVEGENGSGIVAVPEPLYDSIAEGETIVVNGTRGRITKQWYLKEASRER